MQLIVELASGTQNFLRVYPITYGESSAACRETERGTGGPAPRASALAFMLVSSPAERVQRCNHFAAAMTNHNYLQKQEKPGCSPA
jgi:hypothetical protein